MLFVCLCDHKRFFVLAEVAGLLGYDDMEAVSAENMGLEVKLLIIVFIWAKKLSNL